MALPGRVRWTAYRELQSLRRLAAKTGEDLRELVEVPDKLRADLEAFVAAHPDDDVSEDIRVSLMIRDWMLDRLDRRLGLETTAC